MALDLGAPVNTVLLLAIVYYAQRILLPSTSTPSYPPSEFKHGYSWMPKAHPPTLLFQKYTPKTLEPFDGKNGQRILLAINGTVFDVTAGRSFYGPGASASAYLSDCLLLINSGAQMDRMGTLRVETPRAEWPSSPSTWVRLLRNVENASSLMDFLSEMLTPVDQPLDKLEDLTPSEM